MIYRDASASKEALLLANRYTEWSLNFEREDKDSNLQDFDFDTNTVFLSYSASL